MKQTKRLLALLLTLALALALAVPAFAEEAQNVSVTVVVVQDEPGEEEPAGDEPPPTENTSEMSFLGKLFLLLIALLIAPPITGSLLPLMWGAWIFVLPPFWPLLPLALVAYTLVFIFGYVATAIYLPIMMFS